MNNSPNDVLYDNQLGEMLMFDSPEVVDPFRFELPDQLGEMFGDMTQNYDSGYDSNVSSRSPNLIRVEELGLDSLDSPIMISIEDISMAIASHPLLQNCSPATITPTQFNENNSFFDDIMNNDLQEGDDLCNRAIDAYEQSLRAVSVIQLADNVFVPNISPGSSKLK